MLIFSDFSQRCFQVSGEEYWTETIPLMDANFEVKIKFLFYGYHSHLEASSMEFPTDCL